VSEGGGELGVDCRRLQIATSHRGTNERIGQSGCPAPGANFRAKIRRRHRVRAASQRARCLRGGRRQGGGCGARLRRGRPRGVSQARHVPRPLPLAPLFDRMPTYRTQGKRSL